MDSTQQETLLEGLRRVGLNRYEASVYLGLVTDQSARVAEISRRTNVPQPKVYQALDALVDKGFCAIGSDAVNRYRPIPPRVSIAGKIAGLNREVDAARELAEELEVLLLEGQGQELWAPPIEIVKGMRQITRLLVDRIRSAHEEILCMGKLPQVPALEVAKALWDKGEEGCQLRLVLEADYLEDERPGDEEEVALLQRMRAERRATEHVPTKLVLVDRQIALLSVSRSGSENFLVLALRHEGLVAHILSSFERHWERARPLDP